MTVVSRYREVLVALAVLAVVAVIGALATEGGLRPGSQPNLLPFGPTYPDCERLRLGHLAQPVNAWSSLAFVLVGLGILTRRTRLAIAFGAAAIGIGLGSFSFHRSPTEWSAWLDTVGTAAFLIVLIAHNLGRLDRRIAVGLVVIAGVTWWAGDGGDEAVVALLVAAAVGTEYAAWRRGVRRDWGLLVRASALLAASLLVWHMARNSWCDPGSVLQGHALWHAMAAGVVALLFAYFASERAT